jgi:hypothetical protein
MPEEELLLESRTLMFQVYVTSLTAQRWCEARTTDDKETKLFPFIFIKTLRVDGNHEESRM